VLFLYSGYELDRAGGFAGLPELVLFTTIGGQATAGPFARLYPIDDGRMVDQRKDIMSCKQEYVQESNYYTK
jgi:hypothetical protein